MARSEYDQGVNTYSPEGRLHQVEYAIEAIKVSFSGYDNVSIANHINALYQQLGTTAIAIKCADGVVIVAEKRVTSPLMTPLMESCKEMTASEKISEIDKHIACAHSGLVADSRTLVDRARVEAQVIINSG